jgi:dihydrofolate reductase
MKLTTHTQVSVDGVVQANGAADENARRVLDRGGWARPLFDDEAMTFVDQAYSRADAFLFGRRTYELFAGYWGVREDSDNPIVGALNTRPKYVASTTLTEPSWANTTVLSGDLVAAIGELKAEPGGELQVHGSGTLVRWLLANELVDEMNLLVCPVVVGQGTRLFPDAGLDVALDLVDSRAFPKGITLQVYRPTGRPHYAVRGWGSWLKYDVSTMSASPSRTSTRRSSSSSGSVSSSREGCRWRESSSTPSSESPTPSPRSPC